MAVLIVLLVFVVLVVHFANLGKFARAPVDDYELELFDNVYIPSLSPPAEIVIDNENATECHKTLTPCRTNGDCQMCREVFARCVTFNQDVELELDDETVHVSAGSRYCMALSGIMARTCNPHTGTWVMRQVEEGIFSLICSCRFPGIVEQMSIYDDCDVPVACGPNGVLNDLNTSPLRCECDDGFVSEITETGMPYCRTLNLRDVRLNNAYFPRPPCQVGYIESEHPGLDPIYRQLFTVNVCVMDPCSIDPITGERHDGYLLYEPALGADGKELIMCVCPLISSLYPVYSPRSMLRTRYSEGDNVITNACIKPLTVPREEVRSDIKVFWGRNSLKADADVVFQVDLAHVMPQYRHLVFPRYFAHDTDSNVNTYGILKFAIMSAWHKNVEDGTTVRDLFQFWWSFNYQRVHTTNNCPLPGIGQCARDTECGNVSCTTNPCIRKFVNSAFANTCFFLKSARTFSNLGTIDQIAVYRNASNYSGNEFPVTFYLDTRFATQSFIHQPLSYRTVYFTKSEEVVDSSQYSNLATILDTYPLYRA
ncbi:pif-1 [Spodoptera litura granulovirus]|uniref:Pif-1 n=1 Tax=Spodoptera litura granulovirus TaxID=359919 RepID=A5IZR6_9BBAC|nr:pif-1 [Spodoptera litura granulovirus]ABQ52007.1 pif-1 [Spodoptera litura granulovirus]